MRDRTLQACKLGLLIVQVTLLFLFLLLKSDLFVRIVGQLFIRAFFGLRGTGCFSGVFSSSFLLFIEVLGHVFGSRRQIFALSGKVVGHRCLNFGILLFTRDCVETAEYLFEAVQTTRDKFGKAAVNMIKRMNKKLDAVDEERSVEFEGSDDEDEEEPSERGETSEENYSVGLKTMIGAVFQATNAHKCAAPMAAFLTRNESRFRYSHGVDYEDLEIITMDGYFVWCANMSQVQSMQIQLLDGLRYDGEIRNVEIQPKMVQVKANVPIPLDGQVTRDTPRRWRKCHFRAFPVNISNARTIHKLQGRSLDHEVINSWQYRDNWIYVALSRVRTLSGLFLRRALEHSGCKPMSDEIRRFMERLRKKRPKAPVVLEDDML